MNNPDDIIICGVDADGNKRRILTASDGSIGGGGGGGSGATAAEVKTAIETATNLDEVEAAIKKLADAIIYDSGEARLRTFDLGLSDEVGSISSLWEAGVGNGVASGLSLNTSPSYDTSVASSDTQAVGFLRLFKRLLSVKLPNAINGELPTRDAAARSTLNALATGIGTTNELPSIQDTTIETNVRLGSITETAPTTDTGSSGISGRLQRIAQRITALIGLLPASLGQKTEADSLSVVQATPPSITSTVTIQTTGTLAVPFAADSSRKAISINNPKSNTATVFVDVDPNTNFSSTNHMVSLEPGDTFYDDTVLARNQFLLLASAASTVITIRSFV